MNPIGANSARFGALKPLAKLIRVEIFLKEHCLVPQGKGHIGKVPVNRFHNFYLFFFVVSVHLILVFLVLMVFDLVSFGINRPVVKSQSSLKGIVVC